MSCHITHYAQAWLFASTLTLGYIKQINFSQGALYSHLFCSNTTVSSFFSSLCSLREKNNIFWWSFLMLSLSHASRWHNVFLAIVCLVMAYHLVMCHPSTCKTFSVRECNLRILFCILQNVHRFRVFCACLRKTWVIIGKITAWN